MGKGRVNITTNHNVHLHGVDPHKFAAKMMAKGQKRRAKAFIRHWKRKTGQVISYEDAIQLVKLKDEQSNIGTQS
jgi:hypothetical protein